MYNAKKKMGNMADSEGKRDPCTKISKMPLTPCYMSFAMFPQRKDETFLFLSDVWSAQQQKH